MTRLVQALAAWGSPEFPAAVKRDIERLSAMELPLQQELSTGSYALDRDVGAMILAVHESEQSIHVKAGIFYTSVIAGCSCADDPTPVDERQEYCEVLLVIDKISADTVITPA